MFFCHRRIRWALKRRATWGGWGILPQKILKFWCSETPFLVFWEDKFWLKCSLNRLSFLCLFLFAWLRVEYPSLFYISCGFWKFSGCQFQLSIGSVMFGWCHSWYHKELIWKFKNRCQNRDRFFLSRSHIDRDSGFSSKIGRIPTSSSYLRLANVPECLYCRWKVKCSSFSLKMGQFIKIESD